MKPKLSEFEWVVTACSAVLVAAVWFCSLRAVSPSLLRDALLSVWLFVVVSLCLVLMFKLGYIRGAHVIHTTWKEAVYSLSYSRSNRDKDLYDLTDGVDLATGKVKRTYARPPKSIEPKNVPAAVETGPEE